MYILLALIAGAVIGAAVHMLLPHRDKRGVLLSGSLGVGAAAAVYAVLTWAGVAETNPVLWLLSIGAALVVSVVVTWVLSARRSSHDEAEARRLGIA